MNLSQKESALHFGLGFSATSESGFSLVRGLLVVFFSFVMGNWYLLYPLPITYYTLPIIYFLAALINFSTKGATLSTSCQPSISVTFFSKFL